MKNIIHKLASFGVGRKMRLFIFISAASFIVGSFTFLFTFVSDTSVVLAKSASWTPPSGKSLLEVHIANDGTILLRGAKVVSISGTTLTVKSIWDKSEFTWKVTTNASQYGKRHFGTDFFDSKGKPLALLDIAVGDTLLVSGTLDTTESHDFSIKASTIRLSR